MAKVRGDCEEIGNWSGSDKFVKILHGVFLQSLLTLCNSESVILDPTCTSGHGGSGVSNGASSPDLHNRYVKQRDLCALSLVEKGGPVNKRMILSREFSVMPSGRRFNVPPKNPSSDS